MAKNPFARVPADIEGLAALSEDELVVVVGGDGDGGGEGGCGGCGGCAGCSGCAAAADASCSVAAAEASCSVAVAGICGESLGIACSPDSPSPSPSPEGPTGGCSDGDTSGCTA
ncbi:MAG: hypothetical protein IPG50_09870 [Myxococcales bacterium]|nr:hypothetical protein [Myxococcales bacterium]